MKTILSTLGLFLIVMFAFMASPPIQAGVKKTELKQVLQCHCGVCINSEVMAALEEAGNIEKCSIVHPERNLCEMFAIVSRSVTSRTDRTVINQSVHSRKSYQLHHSASNIGPVNSPICFPLLC